MWGATTGVVKLCIQRKLISIHAPRVGCDSFPTTIFMVWVDFNPRTPCGVRPGVYRGVAAQGAISIHAPRVGCDTRPSLAPTRRSNFNPRTPCGVRQLGRVSLLHPPLFQSTHPVWGATVVGNDKSNPITVFQSTHPVWGATPTPVVTRPPPQYFNPRTPCGVRPAGTRTT